jgi:crossover junction endodeoxyribonuclease RuvC
VTKNKQVIIGIDPGTRITGYGIVVHDEEGMRAVDYGCIRPPVSLKLSERYLIIYNGINHLLDTFSPDVLVIETQYIDQRKDVQSIIKLGGVCGFIIVSAKSRGIPIFQYAPTQAKLAVVGQGKASKSQVQRMTQHLLQLKEMPQPEDAADALALALCHAHAAKGPLNRKQEI